MTAQCSNAVHGMRDKHQRIIFQCSVLLRIWNF